MKRRQFLKMIPVGLLSGLVPGFLKAEPKKLSGTITKAVIGGVEYHTKPVIITSQKQADELYGKGSLLSTWAHYD